VVRSISQWAKQHERRVGIAAPKFPKDLPYSCFQHRQIFFAEVAMADDAQDEWQWSGLDIRWLDQ
jgi:hypothetical protein